jgi:hypothetical protein
VIYVLELVKRKKKLGELQGVGFISHIASSGGINVNPSEDVVI